MAEAFKIFVDNENPETGLFLGIVTGLEEPVALIYHYPNIISPFALQGITLERLRYFNSAKNASQLVTGRKSLFSENDEQLDMAHTQARIALVQANYPAEFSIDNEGNLLHGTDIIGKHHDDRMYEPHFFRMNPGYLQKGTNPFAHLGLNRPAHSRSRMHQAMFYPQ